MSIHPRNEERARHWSLFMPPARPSAGEVGVYTKLTKDMPHAQSWTLLGSTPEIRSLAAEQKKQLLCIDQDPNVFGALAALVEGTPNESLSCCDWLDGISEPADVVFGDGSMNMLPPQLHSPFLSKLQQRVKPGGMVLLRVHLMGKPRFATPEEVFSWYRSHNASEPVFTATRTDLDMLWMERGNGLIDFVSYHQKLERLYQENGLTEAEYAAYARLVQHNRIKLYYCSTEVFEIMARDRFNIIGRYPGGDYTGNELHPIYHLQRQA